jgi:hypothetical protein
VADEDLGELSVTLKSIDASFKASMKEVSASLDKIAGKMEGLPTDKMTKKFITARTAMKDFNIGLRTGSDAFDLFTGKAHFSASTISEFAHLIPALSSPIGALITVMGALVGATVKVVEANRKLDQADVARELGYVTDALDKAKGGWERYYDLLKQGVTDKRELELARNAGEAATAFDIAFAAGGVERKKLLDDLGVAEAKLKSVQDTFERNTQGMGKFSPIPPAWLADLDAAKARVDQLKERIGQLDGSFTQEATAVGNATTALNKYKETLKDIDPLIQSFLDDVAHMQVPVEGGFGGLLPGFAQGEHPGSSGVFSQTSASAFSPIKSAFQGGAVGSVIQGAQAGAAGGPIGMLGGAFVGLISQSKGFQDVMAKLNQVLLPIADGLGKVLEPLVPMIGLLGLVVRTELLPVFEILGLEAKALSFVFKGIFDVVKVVILAFLEAVQKFAHAIGIHISGLSAAIDDWKHATYDSLGALGDLGDTADSVSQALLNVPEGFKVASYEFAAMTGTGGGLGGDLGGTGGYQGGNGLGTSTHHESGGGNIYIGTVQVHDADDFLRKMDQVSRRRGYRMAGTTQPTLSKFSVKR